MSTGGRDRLRVGFSTPWDFWDLTPDRRRERLARAADAGLDHVFCADHVSFRGGNGADGMVHMAVMAATEPRLEVYVGVFLLAGILALGYLALRSKSFVPGIFLHVGVAITMDLLVLWRLGALGNIV